MNAIDMVMDGVAAAQRRISIRGVGSCMSFGTHIAAIYEWVSMYARHDKSIMVRLFTTVVTNWCCW